MWQGPARAGWLAALGLLTAGTSVLAATNVSTKVVDRLGRPVTNAVVDIHWLNAVSKKDVRKVDLVRLVSDRDGIVKGTYDETSIPPGKDVWVEISKDGYSGYSTTGLQLEFVLEREFQPADVRRIAGLEGEAQVNELREVLAGDLEEAEPALNEMVFVQEHRFRSALRALIPDPRVGTAAGQLLAFIGVPEDVRLVIELAPPPRREMFKDRWAYGVACALLEPTTEKEWAFLRRCAVNEYDDPWVDAGAIQTLRLLALPRSKQVLQEVVKVNQDRARGVAEAIRYIDSEPTSLADADLVAAGKKVAQAIRIGKWQRNEKPRFNEREDKALVDCVFVAGRDRLTYTATFHKVDGMWKLRGVRETMQALLAREPNAEGGSEDRK